MFTFLQQFVFGTNQTGLVTTSASGVVAVNGGEDPTLSGDILPGQDEIYYGPGVTQSTYVFPQPTIAAWRSIVGPETATATSKSKPTGASNGGHKVELSMAMCLLPLVAWVIS
jgi:carboxypeptidase D